MSHQIDVAFVNQYRDNVEHLVRQSGSKLRNTVRVESQKGEKAFYEFIGASAARKKTSRHSDVTYSDTPHSRRMVVTEYYYDADLVDDDDKIRMLIDPSSDYARVQADAMGLAMDEAIIAAALGTSKGGAEGGTDVAYDSSMTVGVQVREADVSAADLGLNVAKLRRAKRLLDANHVPMGDRYIVHNAAQMESLLGQTKTTSSDFASVKALVHGDIDTFMGFKFVHSEYTTQDANGDDEVLFYHKRGLMLAVGKDIKTRVTELPTKHYSVQTYTGMDIGSTRLQEKLVGKILCDPSAGAGSV